MRSYNDRGVVATEVRCTRPRAPTPCVSHEHAPVLVQRCEVAAGSKEERLGGGARRFSAQGNGCMKTSSCVNSALGAPFPAPSSCVPGPSLHPVVLTQDCWRQSSPQGAQAGRRRTSPAAPGVSAARAASVASSALSLLCPALVRDASGGDDAMTAPRRGAVSCQACSFVFRNLHKSARRTDACV